MIDFTGSTGITIENGEGMVVTSIIDPESSDTIAIVKESAESTLTW